MVEITFPHKVEPFKSSIAREKYYDTFNVTNEISMNLGYKLTWSHTNSNINIIKQPSMKLIGTRQ